MAVPKSVPSGPNTMGYTTMRDSTLATEPPYEERTIAVKIATTEDTCVAAGQCVLSAPSVFAQRADDGKVELLDEAPPAAAHELVREAADFCPSASIHIQD